MDRAASPAGSGGETLRTVSERRQSGVWSGPAVPEVVRQARRAVARFAAAGDVSGVRLDDVQTCVSEAVTNAVMHGFRNGRGPGTVTISAQFSDGALVVVVDDDGAGFAARSDSPGLVLQAGEQYCWGRLLRAFVWRNCREHFGFAQEMLSASTQAMKSMATESIEART